MSYKRMRAGRTTADGTRLAWGFDPTAVGFFLEVRRRGAKTRCYDGLQPVYDRDRPLTPESRSSRTEFYAQPNRSEGRPATSTRGARLRGGSARGRTPFPLAGRLVREANEGCGAPS